MVSITEKTLKDLEFHQVLEQVKAFAISELGAAEITKIRPFHDKELCVAALHEVDDYLSSFENNNRIPNHSFHDSRKVFQLLEIENTYVEAKQLLDIVINIDTLTTIARFLKNFKDIYPKLFYSSQQIVIDKSIKDIIISKITKYAEVADNASPVLQETRRGINKISSQIGASFNRALKKYQGLGYLDTIKESIMEGNPVLAVQAMHRKKVNGIMLGTSKTGSIVFIAPQATLKYTRELQELQIEEREEVIRILKETTDYLRPYRDVLMQYQDYFIGLDLIASKAKYAQSINAVFPKIVSKKIYLREAYHPLLWQQNKQKDLPIVPQTIELTEQQRIIVISGPNAGGKSITLKTIGLLQAMFQSALLIPAHEKSELSFFNTIVSDIGDNQSIENQLSTYSYRLKNMRVFLKKCNKDTLFLIDEFGTGSDPELGGALAEVFLEEFYHKNAFGVITTHYANLKALADSLEFATNANMQFDKRSLEPLYELVTGQAGSSFTFEVARQNGIPYSLINRAKKRVSSSKIRLDKTISRLQTERNIMQQKSHSLEKEHDIAHEKTQELSEARQKIESKLEQFQTLYDTNQKMLQYGRDINELIHKYFQTNNKKQLNAEFLKWVMAERVKFTKKHPPKKSTKKEKKKAIVEKVVQEQKLKKTEKEVIEAVKIVREKKKKDNKVISKKISDYEYNIGDTVRLIDGRAQGTIERIDGKKLLINYGMFTAQATKDKVELVKAVKP